MGLCCSETLASSHSPQSSQGTQRHITEAGPSLLALASPDFDVSVQQWRICSEARATWAYLARVTWVLGARGQCCSEVSACRPIGLPCCSTGLSEVATPHPDIYPRVGLSEGCDVSVQQRRIFIGCTNNDVSPIFQHGRHVYIGGPNVRPALLHAPVVSPAYLCDVASFIRHSGTEDASRPASCLPARSSCSRWLAWPWRQPHHQQVWLYARPTATKAYVLSFYVADTPFCCRAPNEDTLFLEPSKYAMCLLACVRSARSAVAQSCISMPP